jgi:peptide/nickel transport system substrate-binding protein
MPKHLIAEGKIPSFKKAENLIGSGPFTMKRYRKEVQTDHERNPNYFKEGKPYVDGLIHFPIAETATVIAAYKTGQVLMADSLLNNLNPAQASQLADELEGKSIVHWAAGASNIAVMMNTRVTPFDNPNVRKAMNLVLHRQPIIETIGQGQFPIGSPLPPGLSWSYPMEKALQFPGLRSDSSDPQKKHAGDLAEAQKLMKDAGAGPGFKSILYCLRAEEYCDVAVLVKDQLKESLGWDLTIEQGEVAPLWARFLEGDYTFAVQARSCGIFDPDGCFSTYGKDSQSHARLTGFFNEQAQPLWEAQQVETNPAKRTALMGQISDHLLEDSSDVPIYWAVKNWIVSNKIQNFHMPNMSSTHKQHEHLWCDPAC